MKKLIEALHVIKEECQKHVTSDGKKNCKDCPLGYDDNYCMAVDLLPCFWKINDEIQKALL